MSQLITDSDKRSADYRDEPWARSAATLPVPERMRRITACSVLLEDTDHLSDGLYSELVIMREVLQSDDLMHANTYTNQQTALKFLEDMTLWLQTMANEMEVIAQGIEGWKADEPGTDGQVSDPGDKRPLPGRRRGPG